MTSRQKTAALAGRAPRARRRRRESRCTRPAAQSCRGRSRRGGPSSRPGWGGARRPRTRRACSGEAASARRSWVDVGGERGGLEGERTRPAEEDRLVEDAAHGVEVGGEVEVKAQVGVEGEHGHAVARRERGEELLGLPDGPKEAPQAAALEVLLEEQDDEAARRERRTAEHGGAGTRATLGASATQTADSTAVAAPSTFSRKSGGARPGRGRPLVGHPDLENDARGLDAGQNVGEAPAPPPRAPRSARGRREPKGDGHRVDASTQARAGAPC